MWFVSIRDLQHRQRRFVIAVAGTALVFAMGLIGSGLSAGFRAEAQRTVAATGADAFLVPEGGAGPFTGFAAMPRKVAFAAARDAGATEVAGMVIVGHTVTLEGAPENVNVVAHERGTLGQPPLARGRAARRSGEIVVDASLGLDTGDEVPFAGRRWTITGVTQGLTYYGGTPTLFASLADAQALLFQGRDLVGTVAMRGQRLRAPDGYRVMTAGETAADLLRPMEKAIQAVDMLQVLLWLVAATIIGAIVYLSALERVRDFAVLRAVGAPGRVLFQGLLLQAILTALIAAALSVGIAAVLAPVFPIKTTIPLRAVLVLPLVAATVGAASSLAGLRRATQTDPALAFGGASG